MSNRSRRAAASRAEARRRTRQLDRGEEMPADELEEDARGTQPARSGMLDRLFPPAPPLPNRPDPLAGFDYDGPLRSVVAAVYLLANHPRAWLLPAIPWACAQTLAYLTPPTYSLIQIPMVLVSVFAIIAAGWIGWERPWLFGLAAAIAGTLIEAAFLALLFGPLGREDLNPSRVFLGIIVVQIVGLQWILGAFIGWYGGYLRRRMALPAAQTSARRRR